jgi:glutaredoxin-related protein
MLGLVSQVGIADGGENRVMAEEFLHLNQIDPRFDQVRGIGVPAMSCET